MSEWSSNENETPVPATPPAADTGTTATPEAAKTEKPEVPKNDIFATGRLGKNITLNQFAMFANSAKNPEKQLRLNVGISGTGYPFMNADPDENITERTKENNFGKLTARLGGAVFYSLLQLLKVAKTKESGWKIGLQNFHNWVRGNKLDTPQHVNDVMVGVDAEGCVWMTIIENGRESVRFFFGPSQWHNWKKGDGEIATRKEMNHWSLDGYVEGVTQSISVIIGLHAVAGTGDEKFPANANSNQAGGGWNKGGGNNNWKDRNGGGGGWKGNNGGGGWKGNGGGGGGWKGNGGGGGGGWKGNNNGGGGWKGNNGGGGGQWNKGGNNFGNQGGGNRPAPAADATFDESEF